MTMIFKPVFIWKPEIERHDLRVYLTQRNYEKLYVQIHNMFASMTDGLYEKWNEEWNVFGDDKSEEEYIQFINYKCDPIIDKLNYNIDGFCKNCSTSLNVKVKLGEEHNIVLVINDKYELDMVLKEVTNN